MTILPVYGNRLNDDVVTLRRLTAWFVLSYYTVNDAYV